MTCNSAHEHTALSNDSIDSVLRHREVGRTKDLSAPPPSDKNYSEKEYITKLPGTIQYTE